MESNPNNVSFYKLKLQNVIENLKKLEQTQQNELNLEENEIADLMSQTSDILTSLEQQPTQKIKQILQKRKRKRQQAKIKRQKNTRKNESSKVSSSEDCVAIKNLPVSSNNESTTSKKPAQKPHQQLRSYRDANRFLKTFELLELLHSTRSQDEVSTREFASKFSKLRKIWNVIRFENMPDFSAAQNLENQWNTVLFGTNEKSFYKQKRSALELINIRRKWDSYITSDAKTGSCVPPTWVLPPENADDRWECYKIK